MSGPQENLRILQSYEAEYARRVAFAEEGFRDPKVLAGALAFVAVLIRFWNLEYYPIGKIGKQCPSLNDIHKNVI